MEYNRIKKNLFGASHKTWVQLVRNGVVGLVALGADLLVLYVLVQFGEVQKVVASVIASLIAGILSYILSTHWVFDQRKFKNIGVEFLLFTLIGAFGLGLNALIYWVFYHFVGVHYIVAKIISCSIVFLTNFFLRKYIIFFKKHEESSQELDMTPEKELVS